MRYALHHPLNGAGADACEPLALRRVKAEFEFVKTNYRPYDIVVAATLMIAKHHAPEAIVDLSSDEISEEIWDAWQPALELCTAAGVTFSSDRLAEIRAEVGADE